MDEAEVTPQLSPEMEREAAQRAKVRAQAARWDLNVAMLLFAVLIVIIILLFQGIGIEIVAPIAIFGLAMAWLVGWRREKQLYQHFYSEELSKLEQELRKAVKGTVEGTVEELVRKALQKRWR